MPTKTIESTVIGRPTPRIDGPLKVSGTAKYTSDYHFPDMVFAVPVCSTIANGTITDLDTSQAEKMTGVLAVYRRDNLGNIFRTAPSNDTDGNIDEARPPFEDDVIRYYGQYVAMVVAYTFEQAQAAAAAVKVAYKQDKPNVSEELEAVGDPTVVSKRGNPDQAFQSTALKLDEMYGTPVETHNPIELHATVAVWNGHRFTLYETTQGVANHRKVMAQMLGVSREQIEVITRFLGSGFGGKLTPWPHAVLAAAAARTLNRPVKLVISRQMMFQNVGHRPQIQQRVRLSANADGKLTSLQQDYVNHTSILDDYDEGCGEATGYLYSTPNLLVTSGLARRNVGTPTAMRGPGAVPGLFALESAMDELALKLKIDPVELRLRNEPQIDESENIPFSSRHLRECLTLGAEKFGWSRRNAEIGSMKINDTVLGWGAATGSWIAARSPCSATVELKQDGSARVACGTQDIGTGTYTILAQLVSDETGVPPEKVDVVLGDTALPPGPTSGGSQVTASVIPAVLEASQKARQNLLKVAAKANASPFKGKKLTDLSFRNARVHVGAEETGNGVLFSELLRTVKINSISGSGQSEGTPSKSQFSSHSFCAHFVEVTWQPQIAQLRVSRVLTVIDAGRILNPKAASNQIEGAIVMGVGMALFERTVYDPRSGAPINSNLADYLVAVNADAPQIDVTFLDYPDTKLNALGAKGVGEIGLAGVAAAITNAIHHATGVRVRDLPVHTEDLLVAGGPESVGRNPDYAKRFIAAAP
jgi:xanthine dehydrogenase YagR molybdenum-binding subunit